MGTSFCAFPCFFTESVIHAQQFHLFHCCGPRGTPRIDLPIKSGMRPTHDYFYQFLHSRIGASVIQVRPVFSQTRGQSASERIDHHNRKCGLLLVLLRGGARLRWSRRNSRIATDLPQLVYRHDPEMDYDARRLACQAVLKIRGYGGSDWSPVCCMWDGAQSGES